MSELPSRRKLLATAAAAVSVLMGVGHWLMNRPASVNGRSAGSEQTDSPAIATERTETEVPYSEAERITDHGAKPNPDDPDLQSAVRNTEAFRAAATAAGEGGTVYVPSGTYFFGQELRSSNLGFGDPDVEEPAGISIVGDGPERSTLALTEHLETGTESHVMFKYRDVAHGDVEIRDLTIDGNYENLGNLIDGERASRAFEMDGTGHVEFTNVFFRGLYTTALRLREFPASIDRCTFEEIGIGGKDDGGSGHAVETHIASGDTLTITRCSFRRIGSFAINWRYNDGTIIVEDCHVAGTGTGIVKLSAGNRLEIRNSYLQAHTRWLTDHIAAPDDGSAPFHGRHFINRLFDRADRTPTVVLENVEFHDCTNEAFFIRQEPIELKGDMIALHRASGQYGEVDGQIAVFRDFSWTEGAIEEIDIKNLSVHDSTGEIFDTPNSYGTIEALNRGGNAGLGSLGDIRIVTDNPGKDPFQPSVVSRGEVGADFETRTPSDNGGNGNGS